MAIGQLTMQQPHILHCTFRFYNCTRWSLKKADCKVFRQSSRIRIHDGIISDDFDATFQNFMEELHETASSAIPERKVASKMKHRIHKPLLFWNENCSQAIYEINGTRNKAARSKNLEVQIEYQHQQTRRIISDTARQIWEDLCSTLDSQSKLGPVWEMARRMNGAPSNRSIPTLSSDGRKASSNIDKANLLAETYTKTSSTENFSEDLRRHVEDRVEHGCVFHCRRNPTPDPPPAVTLDSDVNPK